MGGAVRDALLNRLSQQLDLDLVVEKGALALCRHLKEQFGGTCITLDMQRDMARLVLAGWTFDFTRREGKCLEEDLCRRDYRLNALGLVLSPKIRLIDPTGGLDDLRNGCLVAVSEKNLVADPLRLLRGVRFVAELNLHLEAATRISLHRYASLLQQAAPERINAELLRITSAPYAEVALPILRCTKLLKPWQSDCNDNAEANANARSEVADLLDHEERHRFLSLHRLTELISNEGLNNLRFSKRWIRRCYVLRQWQNCLSKTNPDYLDEQQRLSLHHDLSSDLPALIPSLNTEQRLSWLYRWRNPSDPLFHPSSPLSGKELQKDLGIPAGPVLGQLLRHLEQERAFGRLGAQRHTAFVEASRWWHCRRPSCD